MAKPIDQVHAPTVVKQDHNDRFIRVHLKTIALLIFPVLSASIAGMIYLYKENKSLWKKNEAVMYSIAGLITYCIFSGLLLFLLSRQRAIADEEDSHVVSFFTDTFYFSSLLAGGLLFITALCEGRAAIAMRCSFIAPVVVWLVGSALYNCLMNKTKSDSDISDTSIV